MVKKSDYYDIRITQDGRFHVCGLVVDTFEQACARADTKLKRPTSDENWYSYAEGPSSIEVRCDGRIVSMDAAHLSARKNIMASMLISSPTLFDVYGTTEERRKQWQRYSRGAQGGNKQ